MDCAYTLQNVEARILRSFGRTTGRPQMRAKALVADQIRGTYASHFACLESHRRCFFSSVFEM